MAKTFEYSEQEALAIILEQETERYNTPDSFFQSLSDDLQIKRDFMVNNLIKIGMKVVIPQGGYFMLVDWTDLGKFLNEKTQIKALNQLNFLIYFKIQQNPRVIYLMKQTHRKTIVLPNG